MIIVSLKLAEGIKQAYKSIIAAAGKEGETVYYSKTVKKYGEYCYTKTGKEIQSYHSIQVAQYDLF